MSHCLMGLFAPDCLQYHNNVTSYYCTYMSAPYLLVNLQNFSIYHWPQLNLNFVHKVQPEIICCCFECTKKKYNWSSTFSYYLILELRFYYTYCKLCFDSHKWKKNDIILPAEKSGFKSQCFCFVLFSSVL